MIWRGTFLCFAMVFFGCGDSIERLVEYELGGATMGTHFSIKLVAPDETIDRAELQQQFMRTLQRIEAQMSTFVADSAVSRFNRSSSTEWIEVSAELCAVVESALAVSRLTDGAFDITVGPLVNLWGFGPENTAVEPPSEEEIGRVLRWVGFDKLEANCSVSQLRKSQPEVYLDLSAYAKGYAVDQLAELLDGVGQKDYLVEVGGEIRLQGHNASREKWAIAIEKPLEFERGVQTIVRLTNGSMATSGDYRNFFEYQGRRYSHTIDSRTGRPVVHNVAAVTVVSDTAAFADAIATALLVLGLEKGIELAEREEIAAYFLLRNDSAIEERMTKMFSGLLGK